MKEQGMFFTDEQKKLLQEIEELENDNISETKTLNTLQRMNISDRISNNFSMLKNQDVVFSSQLFCAMEDYLRECTKNNYELKGL